MGIGNRINTSQDTNELANSKKPREEITFLPEEPCWSLDEIILPTHLKEKILDVAEYTQNSRLVFDIWGLAETHKYSKRIGINLYGAPGTGKTMAAHAIAKHIGRKILAVNSPILSQSTWAKLPKIFGACSRRQSPPTAFCSSMRPTPF